MSAALAATVLCKACKRPERGMATSPHLWLAGEEGEAVVLLHQRLHSSHADERVAAAGVEVPQCARRAAP